MMERVCVQCILRPNIAAPGKMYNGFFLKQNFILFWSSRVWAAISTNTITKNYKKQVN